MRFIIWTALALPVLAGIVFLVGWSLPATREGRAAILIAAPPDRILAVIADVTAQPDWRAGVAAVERTSDGWVEVTVPGERITFAAEAMYAARIRLRFASDAGYCGTWEAVLTPEGAGTRIAVTEAATVPSPLRRIPARVFFNPGAFATTYLAALKARVEGA